MFDSILKSIFVSQWVVFLVAVALLLSATELGFRLGLRHFRAKDRTGNEQGGVIQGGLLGLLGLLLGFTFAMSAQRYEIRRGLVLQEANAIGTTYLRADFLPEEHGSAVKELLRRYVNARLEFYDSEDDRQLQERAGRAAAELHGELWSHAVGSAREAPSPLVASFVTSLNEVIDVDAMRWNALRDHVPGVVWLLVLTVAVCACAAAGVGMGTSGARNGFAGAVLPLLIAVAITLIADLDKPRGGMIRISQQAMIDLRSSLDSAAK